jgi:hypothetical protein
VRCIRPRSKSISIMSPFLGTLSKRLLQYFSIRVFTFPRAFCVDVMPAKKSQLTFPATLRDRFAGRRAMSVTDCVPNIRKREERIDPHHRCDVQRREWRGGLRQLSSSLCVAGAIGRKSTHHLTVQYIDNFLEAARLVSTPRGRPGAAAPRLHINHSSIYIPSTLSIL